MNFREIGIIDELACTVEELGYKEATTVQEKAIPEILNGKDVIVKSKTGTGKTCAYALPAIQKINRKEKGVQVMVVCPTRELAMQVEQEFNKYLTYIDGVKTACLYGGQEIGKQISAIKGNTKIVIGTPGRILEHIRRKNLWTTKIREIILDEADEMLSMGFKEDVEKILKQTSRERNTHLFSATLDKSVLELAKNYTKNAVILNLSEDEKETVENIKEYSVELKLKLKNEATKRFLELYKDKTAIVFCDTKKNVDELTTFLKENGLNVEGLHSDIMQNARTGIIKNFKENKLQALIATDVAARGIDVKDLDLVINYDIPYEDEYYVHRVGRTGRNGKEGMAITYYVGKESWKLDKIKQYTKSKIKDISIPKIEDIENNKKTSTKEITKTILKNEKNTSSETGKVMLNVGKKDNVKAKDILGSLAAYTALSKQDVGHIWVEEEYSIATVPSNYVKEVVTCMQNKEVKGNKVTKVEEVK